MFLNNSQAKFEAQNLQTNFKFVPVFRFYASLRRTSLLQGNRCTQGYTQNFYNY